eukprot:363981-Pyramimonas_sp.AAC.1
MFLDCMHGGSPFRRRGAAIRVQLITSWRSAQMGVSHATDLHDQANAPGSTSQQSMDDSGYHHYDMDDAWQGKQNNHASYSTVDAADGVG